MALYHTTVVDNQIKALPTVSTASGSVATFETDMTENLIEVKCQIVPVQSGSGTPSPSNPRPIQTYTSLNLSHSGSDTSNPNVTNIPFGQTVANGVIDITTGKLRVTWGYANLGDLNWSMYQNNKFYTTISGIKLPTTYPERASGMISSYYSPANAYAVASMPDKSFLKFEDASFYIRDDDYSDATAFKTALQTANAQLVYELATPQEIQLSSTQITALLNENNIWCDTGDTEVKFLLTVGKKI